MVLMTKDGTTLFETVPRTVSFQPSTAYAAGMTGNAVYVDGVPIAAGAGGNTDASGKIAGLVQLRDSVSATMQSQLDEIARGLITAFAETDQPAAPASRRAGPLHLAGRAGNAGRPARWSTASPATIRLNAAMDSSAGGNPQLLRDGGANGAAYVANPTGGASYADLLIAYGDRLEQPMAFDAAAGIGATSSLSNYSTSAIGWFEGLRQEAFARRRIQGGAGGAHRRGAVQRDRRQCRHGNVAAARPRTFLRGLRPPDQGRRRDAGLAARGGEVAP